MKAAVPDWLVEKSYRTVGHRKELFMEKAHLYNPRIYGVLLRVRLALAGAAVVALSVGSTERYVPSSIQLIHTGALLA